MKEFGGEWWKKARGKGKGVDDAINEQIRGEGREEERERGAGSRVLKKRRREPFVSRELSVFLFFFLRREI